MHERVNLTVKREKPWARPSAFPQLRLVVSRSCPQQWTTAQQWRVPRPKVCDSCVHVGISVFIQLQWGTSAWQQGLRVVAAHPDDFSNTSASMCVFNLRQQDTEPPGHWLPFPVWLFMGHFICFLSRNHQCWGNVQLYCNRLLFCTDGI